MDQLKVFISSTQKDLQLERNSAQAVIEQLGHQCLRAEMYDAPGTSPEFACKEMAKDCHIYIGIYGPRYGYIVPEIGISATEMEYREARKNNHNKIFIYVKNTNDIEPDQNRFLEEVEGFCNGYFRHERFSDSSELMEQVRRDVITWTTQQIRRLLGKEIEMQALRDKVAHLSRVMELYGIPEELR